MKIRLPFLLIATNIYNNYYHFILIYTFIYFIITRLMLVDGELGRNDHARLIIGKCVLNYFIV